ncbi:hypothetical protein PG990_001182 [Apiospora arundinis]
METREDYSQHTCLRTQCDICDGKLMLGDSFIPLACIDSIQCWERASLPHDTGYRLRIQGRLLCWKPNCWRCKQSPEAVAIHPDCLSLFKKQCQTEDALDRLWARVASRRPWREAPALQLDPEATLDLGLVCAKAEQCGIPGLKLLPPELIHMVYEYSEHATFWRYIDIVRLGKELEAASLYSRSLPLRSILAWTRGSRPYRLQSPGSSCLRIIRLTIDYRGLRQVERLRERPSYRHGRSDSKAFVILTDGEDDLENITMHYKYGFSFLEMPGSFRGFHIWDMPNPPLLAQCQFTKDIPQSTRFRTVDVRSASGLTFFFCNSKMYGIYGHTHAAKKQRAANQRGGVCDMAWIHLPIPEGEEIRAIVLRMRRSDGVMTRTQNPCFLFRMKLAGDVSIGPYHTGDYEDIVFSRSSPELLIHNVANVGIGPATILGTYNTEFQNAEVNTGESSSSRNSNGQNGEGSSASLEPFDPPQAGFGGNVPPPSFEDRYSFPIPPLLPPRQSRLASASNHPNFSSSSLENVTAIHVLQDEKKEYCQAVVLEYENGARRALGHCRPAGRLDGWELGGAVCPTAATTTYRTPSRICYKDNSNAFGELPLPSHLIRRLVQVEGGRELPTAPHGHHPGDGWVCSPLEGILKLWFWESSTVVSIAAGAEG